MMMTNDTLNLQSLQDRNGIITTYVCIIIITVAKKYICNSPQTIFFISGGETSLKIVASLSSSGGL